MANKLGFLPAKKLNYYYHGVNSVSAFYDLFQYFDGNFVQLKNENDMIVIRYIDRKGLYKVGEMLMDHRNNINFISMYKKNKKYPLLKFPVKKNDKWKVEYGSTRQVVETNASINGLKNVIVVKEWYSDEFGTTYYYYHKDYGELGRTFKTGKVKTTPAIDQILYNIK
ncbi:MULTISPECIES: hypothetical protein [unclassified Peribacillus]|uniref:hypothetical protein n=1 Tax=unclassified Peribacillus TaxID=2675266 RepID=UPI00191483F5|nr:MULTISPECIES: hypothetical protein [unclassified Peribacillus]MBK5446822.1 hypothetical protein [Peribacillus sp. TH24]MBK5502823.1 hypothetical protein [Peribacillus sp. TH14]